MAGDARAAKPGPSRRNLPRPPRFAAGAGARSALQRRKFRTTRRPRVLISRGPMTSSRITTLSMSAIAIFRSRPIRWPPGPSSTIDGVAGAPGQVVQTVRQETGQGMVLNPLMVTPAVSVRICAAGRHHAAGRKILCAFGAGAHRSETGAKGTVQLELPPGWRAEPATAPFCHGAGRRGAKRRLPGVPRSPGGKALHRHGGGGIRRPAISRGIHHRRLSRPASVQSLLAGDVPDLRREREGRAGAARRLRHRHGRRRAAIAREHRHQGRSS